MDVHTIMMVMMVMMMMMLVMVYGLKTILQLSCASCVLWHGADTKQEY